MSKGTTIRISESTKKALERYGTLFDTPDDVIKKIIKSFEALAEKKNEKPEDLIEKAAEEGGGNNEKAEIPKNKKYQELIDTIENLDSDIAYKCNESMISFYDHPELKKGSGLAWLDYPENNKIPRVHIRKLNYPKEVDPEDRINYEGGFGNYPYLKNIWLEDENDKKYLMKIIKYAISATEEKNNNYLDNFSQ